MKHTLRLFLTIVFISIILILLVLLNTGKREPSYKRVLLKSIATSVDLSPNLTELIESGHERNSNASIRNAQFLNFKYDLKSEDALMSISPYQSLVILVQVHNRINYLREVISSLKEVKHIEESLVIFSHDFYDEQINRLIETIEFCPTLQLFYPYSIQTYTDRFPGRDPNDCPEKIPKKVHMWSLERALINKCNYADKADSSGHYRNPEAVQIKHHFFWKLGYIFDKLPYTRHIDNLKVLLIEDDHFLMPDAIHMIRQLSKQIVNEENETIQLSIKAQHKEFPTHYNNKYYKTKWFSNLGLVMTRPIWNQFKSIAFVCTYDELNWDWTLQYSIQYFFNKELQFLYPIVDRVKHIGLCGVHIKSANCDPSSRVSQFKRLYSENKETFFPDRLEMKSQLRRDPYHKIPITQRFGGWSDPRDISLCMHFLSQES